MTRDTPAAALETASAEDLRKLMSSVRYALWDFDGPICRLFAGLAASQVAREFIDLLKEGKQDEQLDLLPMTERLSKDPHAMLVTVARRHPNSDRIVKLEEWLTGREIAAAHSAFRTPHAKEVIQAWGNLGVQLAVSTNNSARAAARYLAAEGLDCFFPHIYGRTHDLSLMKPHPHTLLLALDAMGADPSETLMLGDASTDYTAAQAADVPFLAYADTFHKVEEFHQKGVEPSRIVRSLKDVRDVLSSQN
ncbi:HAD family hydrolase [Streptomyces geranii]|uniref:HAD family hydrolase n=1 Tax=Streptomyces geranii TaxID=2058923 RepID=UPI000D0325E7|nr:HAD-IA family hydrolase [Streptomyces geranii]